jgi:hypothetical protein
MRTSPRCPLGAREDRVIAGLDHVVIVVRDFE